MAKRTKSSPAGNGKADPMPTIMPILNKMAENFIFSRASFINSLIDPRRDVYKECGYPETISIEMYNQVYKREGIATKIVDIYPEECWAVDPELREREENVVTSFEGASEELIDQFNLWGLCERIDKRSGIGWFGIFLIGFDDANNKNLEAPVDGVNEDGGVTKEMKLNILYIRTFDQNVVKVAEYEKRQGSPRFGHPKFYEIMFTEEVPESSLTSTSVVKPMRVHWSRVVHIADNPGNSLFFAPPRMEKSFNRIYDLQKVVGGSAEMFWKGAFPGYSFEVNPDIALNAPSEELETLISIPSIKKEIEAYSHGLQRYLALIGVSAKSLAPQVASPGEHLDAILKTIAMSIGVPYRVFLGSEEAKLSSSQDMRTWNKRLRRRHTKYISPDIIKRLWDRFILFGVVPKPDKYRIWWPDLNIVTDSEKADVALKRTQALVQYIQGAVEVLVPPREFFSAILELPLDVTTAILDAVEKNTGQLLTEVAQEIINPQGGENVKGDQKKLEDKTGTSNKE